ncbi:leucyl aminopeptidase [Rickettsia endosymbiont of Cardiosporidium cionae]|uniref:leucyl aminopeptidase n=1 Tax=Rickettsia endosymbiont of Cardiosporidium cionae TaxID=2777155 RepID=UPI00189574C1|nr:leucyl aminopeptidase [Rickettsia endosymbiont of Cardiosporidium cionae]KAF8818886.1 leucyl aminopeptidase [Rickettsia endosymbiont of Cardiosporidium cionae]
MLNISFQSIEAKDSKHIVLLVNEQLKIDNDAITLDNDFGGIISKKLQDTESFKGNFKEYSVLTATSDESIKYIILLGIGNESDITLANIEELGAKIGEIANKIKAETISIKINSKIGHFSEEQVCSNLGGGALLSAYKFNKYITNNSKDESVNSSTFKNIDIITDNVEKTVELHQNTESVVQGIYLARDCINEPPNILNPAYYSTLIVNELEMLGVDVQIMGEIDMRRFGMGAMLGVGNGSASESKIVIMQYNGSVVKEQNPLCLVGKGVTFDTGGISLKPALNMDSMKSDMGGAAAIVGLIKTLALRKANVNVVGVVGLVENMPGGNAQRPSDIVTSMSGQTIEVLNTDAEGRLVLCDCIAYVQEMFKPDCIIDLATLTGAILIALGNTYAGCFSNDDTLAEQLIEASNKTGEKLWRMPLHKDFDKMLNSDVADIANISREGGGLAGSSVAAHFIQRFIQSNIKWCHLDIAGVAWNKKSSKLLHPRGGIGFGVKLLNQFIYDNYEL